MNIYFYWTYARTSLSKGWAMFSDFIIRLFKPCL